MSASVSLRAWGEDARRRGRRGRPTRILRDGAADSHARIIAVVVATVVRHAGRFPVNESADGEVRPELSGRRRWCRPVRRETLAAATAGMEAKFQMQG